MCKKLNDSLLFVWFVFFRKKSSKAEKSELVEKILNLIAGHSHEVSILCPIKTAKLMFESFWTHLNYRSIINDYKLMQSVLIFKTIFLIHNL